MPICRRRPHRLPWPSAASQRARARRRRRSRRSRLHKTPARAGKEVRKERRETRRNASARQTRFGARAAEGRWCSRASGPRETSRTAATMTRGPRASSSKSFLSLHPLLPPRPRSPTQHGLQGVPLPAGYASARRTSRPLKRCSDCGDCRRPTGERIWPTHSAGGSGPACPRACLWGCSPLQTRMRM